MKKHMWNGLYKRCTNKILLKFVCAKNNQKYQMRIMRTTICWCLFHFNLHRVLFCDPRRSVAAKGSLVSSRRLWCTHSRLSGEKCQNFVVRPKISPNVSHSQTSPPPSPLDTGNFGFRQIGTQRQRLEQHPPPPPFIVAIGGYTLPKVNVSFSFFAEFSP